MERKDEAMHVPFPSGAQDGEVGEGGVALQSGICQSVKRALCTGALVPYFANCRTTASTPSMGTPRLSFSMTGPLLMDAALVYEILENREDFD